jgi:hypothetical protein
LGINLSDAIKEREERIACLREQREEIDAEIRALEAELTALRIEANQLLHRPPTNSVDLPTVYEPLSMDSYSNENEPIVSKASIDEEKYRLFISLFEGRSDVHARRFQSAKSGMSGYSPVCLNEFNRMCCTKGRKGVERIKCTKCEYQNFPPISIEEFNAHRHGVKDNCSDVLGAYPVDADEMCSFIAVDFDTKKPNRDSENQDEMDVTSIDVVCAASSAFMNICASENVPAYLERSRSGRGMHVWIFFSEPAPAKLARRLCAKMMTLAMERYPELNFDCYDRMIPSQDTLPDGGFGNLIALPLQGRAGKKGNSLFVDAELVSYPDQWRFLSGVRKMTMWNVEAVLSRLTSTDELGELLNNETEGEDIKPWEKRKPEIELTSDDFHGTVELIRANMIHAPKSGLSPRAVNKIRRLGAFKNPDFYKSQAMHLSTYDKPRIISTSEETTDYISIPRGAEEKLAEVISNAGAEYKIVDKTTGGNHIAVTFAGELRDEQIPAAEALLNHNIGVLSATTAFGKTVIGAYLIASKAVNALVLVHTQQLQSQWMESLDTFLDISEEPPVRLTPKGRRKKVGVVGEYGGQRKNLSGIVDVAMMQSLTRGGEIPDFVKDYGLVIVVKCHNRNAICETIASE